MFWKYNHEGDTSAKRMSTAMYKKLCLAVHLLFQVPRREVQVKARVIHIQTILTNLSDFVHGSVFDAICVLACILADPVGTVSHVIHASHSARVPYSASTRIRTTCFRASPPLPTLRADSPIQGIIEADTLQSYTSYLQSASGV